jgi:hypothetical protein
MSADATHGLEPRFYRDRSAFQSARYQLLYRAWRHDGKVILNQRAAPFSGTPRPERRDDRDEYLRSTAGGLQARRHKQRSAATSAGSSKTDAGPTTPDRPSRITASF